MQDTIREIAFESSTRRISFEEFEKRIHGANETVEEYLIRAICDGVIKGTVFGAERYVLVDAVINVPNVSKYKMEAISGLDRMEEQVISMIAKTGSRKSSQKRSYEAVA